MAQDRQKHLDAGQDPDSMESVMEDVGHSLTEALQMIEADAASKGFTISNIDNIQEPPKPDQFPVHEEAMAWRIELHRLFEQATQIGLDWPQSEAGLDLAWYSNTLLAKIYRQCCNRWHLEMKDEYGEEDFEYTSRVLKEVIAILQKSLARIAEGNYVQGWKMKVSESKLEDIAVKIWLI